MTNYPNSLDNIFTLPTVAGSDDKAVAINALQSATLSIEKELGVTPKGIYSDVRTRLDILESRININTDGYYIPDGYVNSPLFLVNSFYPLTVTISAGDGFPTEDRLDGSLYLRRDGYVNQGLYARRGGVWKEITTDPWVASGDLSGTYLSQTVIGIRGKTLSATLSSIGTIQDGYHLTWNDALNQWEEQTGFIASGDLEANSPYFGRIRQKVVGLQNRTLSSAAPSDTDSLVWNDGYNRWEPRVTAIIFDGYSAKLNLRSNRGATQSPIDNTKIGIVNFSSRSSGSTTGATENYTTIVGGDRHIVNNSYASVLGGLLHVVSGQYGVIIGGNANQASGQYSTVVNGTNNQSQQTHAFIGDGYSNTASGINSLVLNGGGNTSSALYSSILNGSSNSISSGSSYAAVGFGSNNTITGTSTYSIILGGNNNTTIQSNYSSIINGQTNNISTASNWSFIGNGNNITATGLYATILNSTVATVNGLHGLILNGNTNSVIGNYSTIGNGNNNTINSNVSYATILDGYNNTISSNGGLIIDGYNNTVSGIWSTILNGNNNTINGRNSTILNGNLNIIDANSSENIVLIGTNNQYINTNNSVVVGSNNILNNISSHFILGSNNNHQSTFSFTNGNFNVSSTGSSFNIIWGTSNNIGANTTINGIFGNSNNLGTTTATSNNFVAGNSNIIDGYNNSTIFGSNNIANAKFSLVQGQYGKARLFGQKVMSNSRFNSGNIGEAQFSRIILTGSAVSGGAIPLQLQDNSPVNPTFVDGYCYEMCIRVLVVNTAPISPNPVVPARFVFDVLAHQESGTLILDNINQTLITPQASGNPWTVSITTSGNQLIVTVDAETGPPYVQPTNTPSSRRAIATIEWRELTRL
jgi:hypothetical protein